MLEPGGEMSGGEGRMDVHFQVEYWTSWGQCVALCGSSPLLGNWDVNRGRRMTCYHKGEGKLVWELSLSMPVLDEVEYCYAVVEEGGEVVMWESVTRKLHLENCGARAEVMDTWQDRNSPTVVMATPAFRRAIGLQKTVVMNGEVSRQTSRAGHAIFRFFVRDWLCEDGESLHVIGGIPQLGNWQTENSYPLTETESPVREGEVLVPVNAFPFTYKFIVVSKTGAMWEQGESRLAILPLCTSSERTPSLVVADGGYFRHARFWRGAGIAVPVFSLRTELSVGVGEFRDMRMLIDFYDIPEEVQEEISVARTELDLRDMDYEKTMEAKLRIAKTMYALQGSTVLKSASFQKFFQQNRSWLKPYAVFCFLRDLFGTAEHWKWGTFSTPNQEKIDRIADPNQEFHGSIQFIYYLQFHLHKQLVDVRMYAESKGVALKGDLPIGVHKCSVDTWMAPSQFRMDKSTGAPPDYFDPEGQNWGFPTYNWEEMARDGYTWWCQRLGKLSEYFHAYRIDHILGFFRIWEIPADCKQALLGCFRPSYPVTRCELESLGVWDIDRLCEPYVLFSHLEDAFGDLAQEVGWKYFYKGPGDIYRFREEYHSEVKIVSIVPRKNSSWLVHEVTSVKEGLLKLFQNVVLIRHPKDKDAFYPRFRLQHTDSFAGLSQSWKEALSRLHDDYYYHKHNDYWASHALKTLPVLIESSDMLVCGEDLGMVPSCVHPVMQELGLLGLRIQRMPSEEGKTFGDTSSYPYLTVCSPSCHDVLTSRAWWEEDENLREEFYHQVMKGKGRAPEQCTPEIMKYLVEEHMASPSVLTIIPIQDMLALSDAYNTRPASEETINNPRNPRHYWRYRMHITLETLMEDTDFQMEVLSMMKKSYRGAKNWQSRQEQTNSTSSNVPNGIVEA